VGAKEGGVEPDDMQFILEIVVRIVRFERERHGNLSLFLH
jgi:hypothetical protein